MTKIHKVRENTAALSTSNRFKVGILTAGLCWLAAMCMSLERSLTATKFAEEIDPTHPQAVDVLHSDHLSIPTTDANSNHINNEKNPSSALTEADQARIQQRLSCLDPDGPQPVILISLGRSGSSSIWQMMGNLTGYETSNWELPGSNGAQQQEFFSKHEQEDAYPGQWMIDSLCKMQQRVPRAGIVGFKWKPFKPSWTYQSALAALELIGHSSTIGNVPIKVVRSRRNLLDVFISVQKHKHRNAPARCRKDEEQCLDSAFTASTALQIDTNHMLQYLRQCTSNEDQYDQLLQDMGVSHIQVEYERLYYNYHAPQEWQRIFQFLGRGPEANLTLHKLEKASVLAPTHSAPTQKVTLSNFEEVVGLLEGTEFEHLLH